MGRKSEFYKSLDVSCCEQFLKQLQKDIEASKVHFKYDFQYYTRWCFDSTLLGRQERSDWLSFREFSKQVFANQDMTPEYIKGMLQDMYDSLLQIFNDWKEWKIQDLKPGVFYLNLNKEGTEYTVSEFYEEIEQAKLNRESSFYSQIRLEV